MSPAPLSDLHAMLKRLHLPTVRRLYPDLVIRAEAEGMSYSDFLEILVSEEIAHRAQTRITRSIRKAKFPFLRTIEEFDFTFQSSVRLQMLGTLLGPELVSEGRCAILSGPPGRGKTHLGVAIGYRAIQNGFETRFTTADELIGELSIAAQRSRLEEALEPYVHPHVLVIDELGYQSYAADAANVLFRVVSQRRPGPQDGRSLPDPDWRPASVLNQNVGAGGKEIPCPFLHTLSPGAIHATVDRSSRPPSVRACGARTRRHAAADRRSRGPDLHRWFTSRLLPRRALARPNQSADGARRRARWRGGHAGTGRNTAAESGRKQRNSD